MVGFLVGLNSIINGYLTPIWGISGMSRSVISGQKIQSHFFGFDDVIPDRYFCFIIILNYVSNANYTPPGKIT